MGIGLSLFKRVFLRPKEPLVITYCDQCENFIQVKLVRPRINSHKFHLCRSVELPTEIEPISNKRMHFRTNKRAVKTFTNDKYARCVDVNNGQCNSFIDKS